MEQAILAIAACALLAVQSHRNYLMVQAAKRPPLQVNVQAPKPGYLTVDPPVNNISVDIDYDKLGKAIEKAVLGAGVNLYNAKLPVIIPNDSPPQPQPYWQAPVVSEAAPATEPKTITTTSGVEVPVRKF